MKDEQLMEKYLEQLDKVETRIKSTVAFNRRILGNWLKFLTAADKQLIDVKPADFVDWLTVRREKIIDSTIQKELCVLRKFHFFLYDFRFLKQNPAKSLPPMICARPDEKSFLSVDECFSVLDQIDTSTDRGKRDHAMIALLWSTGLRTGEACDLKWDDIDLDEATLLVREGKGQKQRQLFLNDHILEDLLTYRKHFAAADESPVFFSVKPNGMAPPTDQRKSLRGRSLTEAVSKRAAAAGIERHITAMTWRHTFATHMFEAETPIDDIKEMLGHDLDTDTCIYIHVSMDTARKLLNAHEANPFYQGYWK